MFLCNFTKCLSYQHESTKLLLRYKLSKVNTFISRQVLCSVCSTARKSCFGSTGWHLGMIMLSDWIVPIELHGLKQFLNQASDYCLDPRLQHGTPHVCFNLLYLPHIRTVWAHKSCLRNEYQGFDSFISAVCSSSGRQDDLPCWVFALDGQMNSVIYVYLHLALQTKAGRNSFLNICPSACWWAFLFGRNFKVIVNHKYLKIASPLIKQPQKHFNDRRHESDLLASVLHTLYVQFANQSLLS